MSANSPAIYTLEGKPMITAYNDTLTAVEGVLVGHHTLSERTTGCTVVLVPDGAVAGVDVRGAAPGTRETDLLDPVNTVEEIQAVVLAGGSAFGLDAASGVVRFLEEKGVGFDVGVAKVPIVPAAVLFDLTVGDRPDVRPTAECGYQAAQNASRIAVLEGSVGAGAGATVGKLGAVRRPMKGGIGSAAIALDKGEIIAALVAVNAVGDVIDPSDGRLVAGALDGRGELADARCLLLEGTSSPGAGERELSGQNTTLVVVATNLQLSKVQATKIAQMAHDGLARTLYPAHTPFDGDTAFALATGHNSEPVDLARLGALAAEVTARAVVRAVEKAAGLAGIPSVSDLRKRRR